MSFFSQSYQNTCDDFRIVFYNVASPGCLTDTHSFPACYATLLRYCTKLCLKAFYAWRNRRNAPSMARFSSPLRPCRSVSVLHGIISTLSKQLRYSHVGKLCVPVGQPGLAVIYSRKISSEVKMQIPRCQVLQAQYLWHGLRFLRMPCLQRPLQFSPKGV